MSGGERPIGTAKGKQPNTEALCQTSPPPAEIGLHWRTTLCLPSIPLATVTLLGLQINIM